MPEAELMAAAIRRKKWRTPYDISHDDDDRALFIYIDKAYLFL
jgi:hypothetical protein